MHSRCIVKVHKCLTLPFRVHFEAITTAEDAERCCRSCENACGGHGSVLEAISTRKIDISVLVKTVKKSDCRPLERFVEETRGVWKSLKPYL